jgi:hypothetical protein
MNRVTKTLAWGRHQLTLETGEIARQATGAVLVNMDDTGVLVTVVGANEAYFCSRKCFEQDIRNQAEDYAFNLVHGIPIKARKVTL